MTNEFKETMAKRIEEWKAAGFSPADALRATEIACGKENEEFHHEGTGLVEAAYGGTFHGKQANDFRVNDVVAEAPVDGPHEIASPSTPAPKVVAPVVPMPSALKDIAEEMKAEGIGV